MSSQYLSQVNMTIEDIQTPSPLLRDEEYFKDKSFLINNSFNFQNNYYVKLQIKRTLVYDQNFQIILKNDNETTAQQFIKNFFVPKLEEDDEINKTVVVELVFNPIINFDRLILKLTRITNDYALANDTNGWMGRVIELGDCVCYTINNLLNLSFFNGISELIKIGIQGSSGLLMCINGEEIRVGPSGIYQIKNGYKITFIGFVLIDGSNDYFLLDYQY